jgi:antitoxin (DNA-binding transcriptional repressor) of toxin-antitoxin stability system
MKVIPLSEAKANLSRYGRLCQEEPVIVTIDGVPSFQLSPLQEDDDLIDRLLAENPEFGRLMEQRSRERTVSQNEARKRLRSGCRARLPRVCDQTG